MSIINAEMMKLLNDTDIWVLATAENCGNPNAVPVYFTKVLDGDRLLLVDNYMKKTLGNIQSNSKVSVSVWNEKKGYQFKGTACIETSGVNFDTGNAMVKEGNPKGVIIVDVESIYITSPGPEAGNKVD